MIPMHHLIVVGFDEIVANKYLPCIRDAINSGHINSYSIIDLESQRTEIDRRIQAASVKPRGVVYLPDSGDRVRETPQELIAAAVQCLRVPGVPTKVYIATEVRAHEAYLRFCVENHISSLVEKPVLAPVVDGRFKPSYITKTMEELIGVAAGSPAEHSVMTLSRYHQIYNQKVVASLRERMERWETPLTSFHLRAAGGVWNLQREFESRDDHPYKYGYGMMMHGAYHYVDLATQIHLDRLSQHAGVHGATAFARASRHRLLVRSFGETTAGELSHGPAFRPEAMEPATGLMSSPVEDAPRIPTEIGHCCRTGCVRQQRPAPYTAQGGAGTPLLGSQPGSRIPKITPSWLPNNSPMAPKTGPQSKSGPVLIPQHRA